jgi:uncharacterized membrane protein YjjP (DUF1212 family)
MGMDENDVLLRERVTRIEQDLKSEIEQRKKLDAVVEDMRDIVSEIRHMRLDLQSINTKVNALEEKPAKRWDTVVVGIIAAIAGGLGTLILSFMTGGQ